MDRAFVALEIKALNDDERLIEGWASRVEEDRMGDVVMPKGAVYNLPLPFLLDHDHKRAVGEVHRVEVTNEGIRFWAHIKQIAEPGEVKDLCDSAWQLVKSGLRKAVSIGFKPLEYSALPTGGMKFISWEWLELSAVSVPAHQGALITGTKSFQPGDKLTTVSVPAVKSISQEQMAASGQSEKKPGVSGQPVKLHSKGAETMSLADQIASLEAKRAANAAQMETILSKSADAGETTSADDQEEFDALEAEVQQIDADIKRFRSLERVKLASAQAPAGTKAADDATRHPGAVPAQVRLSEKLDKGIGFARLAKVKALAKLDGESVRTVAKELYGENSAVFGIVNKAPVPAGSTLDGNWAAPLYGEGTDVIADFVEFLRPRTILGRFGQGGVPSLRAVPFNVPLVGQTEGGEGYWVGEGRAKPLTRFGYERNILEIFKVANIAVVTEELLRRSSPAAEAMLRDQLAAAIAARLDIDFINPAKAAVAGVSPASITNGLTPVTSAGGDADAVRSDVRALMATFIAANNAPTSGVWIMGSTTALALSMMVNPLGQAEFAGISMMGGTFQNMPAIVSDYIPAGTIVLANANDIYLADEGGMQVDMSREASLEMADNPAHNSTTPTPSASLVSMFQTNSVAFRVERFINWSRRRPSAVAILTGATWGAASAPETP